MLMSFTAFFNVLVLKLGREIGPCGARGCWNIGVRA